MTIFIIWLGLGVGGLILWCSHRAFWAGWSAGRRDHQIEMLRRTYTSPAFHTIIEQELQEDHDPYL